MCKASTMTPLFGDDAEYRSLDGKRRWCNQRCWGNFACAVVSIAFLGLVISSFVFAIRPDWNHWGHSNGLMYYSAETSKTATGTTIADAYVITKSITVFTTTANGTGAALPTPANDGLVIFVFNEGANALTVYPPATHTLNGGATASVTSGTGIEFVYAGNTTWFY